MFFLVRRQPKPTQTHHFRPKSSKSYNGRPKKKLYHRVPDLDRAMDLHKLPSLLLRLRHLLLSTPSHSLPLRDLEKHAGFVQKWTFLSLAERHPTIFRVSGRPLVLRLTESAARVSEGEEEARREVEGVVLGRLKRLLMMAGECRVEMEKVRLVSEDVGLPEEWEREVSEGRWKGLFDIRVLEGKEYLCLESWDPALAVTAREEKLGFGLEVGGGNSSREQRFDFGSDGRRNFSCPSACEETLDFGMRRGENSSWGRPTEMDASACEERLDFGLSGTENLNRVRRTEMDANACEERFDFGLSGAENSSWGRRTKVDLNEREERFNFGSCREDKLGVGRRKEVLGPGNYHGPFAFKLSFAPGFRPNKSYLQEVVKWQKMAFPSPYLNAKTIQPATPQARKRAVAVLHELLSLTMYKRLTSDKLDAFHNEYQLPCKLLLCLVKNHGIFYITNKGAKSTVILKEAYDGPHLVEKCPLVRFYDRFAALTGRKTPDSRKPMTAVLNQV